MKLAILVFVSAGAYGQQPPDLSGVWMVSGSIDIAGDLPYKPDMLKLWQQRKANLTKEDPASYCLPNGVVRVTDLPYKIVQTPKLVVLLFLTLPLV